MTRRQKIVLAVTAVFLISIVATGFLFRAQTQKEQEKISAEKAAEKKTASVPPPGGPPAYTPEVPKGMVESKPQEVAPVVGTENKHGTFKIQIINGRFEPSSLAVKKGDVVSFEFIPAAVPYDFYIPAYGAYKATLPADKESRLDFRASDSGTFLFECRDYCPADRKITGQFVILP